MEIFKNFTFDSAHYLPNVPDEHKCKAIHGHTYSLTIYIEGPLDPNLGWVMDFADIKHVMAPLIQKIDHKLLNDIDGLENPTCEILAAWLWKNIKNKIPKLSRLELNETPTSGVVYKGV
jgi:6-pyruvoyltetrahydropterin/6-carboxytetrahydropterin synthase